jgi:hypothetical protein
LVPGWQNAEADEATIRSWAREYPDHANTGILTRETPAIDIDILDVDTAKELEELLRKRFAGRGRVLRRIGKYPKRAFPFKTTKPFKKLILTVFPPGTKDPKRLQRIEVLADGQQLVVDGIHPDTGRRYRWKDDIAPWTVARAKLPSLSELEAKRFLRDAGMLLEQRGWTLLDDTKGVNDHSNLPLIVELGRTLWDEPTQHRGCEYRFGTHGSKVIDAKARQWFDHETRRGGGLSELRKLCEARDDAKTSVIVRASEIAMRGKDWLWEGHVLRGAQELSTGLPGLGKSLMHCSMVACVTARLPWPNGAPANDPMNVVMLTAEDSLDQELVPRLVAAGANLSRVHIFKHIKRDKMLRGFLLAEDLNQLEKDVKRIGNVGLITIDPITAFMGGAIDGHKATEVRSQLGPLKDFAERLQVAVSTITHPAKNSSQKAIDQFIGSQAFIAAGRIGHVVVEEVDEDGSPTGRCLFTNCKNNAGPKMPTLAYRIETTKVGRDDSTGEKIIAVRLAWDKAPVDISADQAVAAAGKKEDRGNEVRELLSQILAHGPVAQKLVEEKIEKCAISPKRLRTAKEKMGVVSEKIGGRWFWRLP